MYKKVIVPVSGEEQSRRGLAALEKAKQVCDGEFVLLHVTEPVPQTVGGEAREELRQEKEANGLAALRPVIEKLQTENLPFHTRVVPGTPAETIVKIADEEKADLIVMFTDGRDDIGDMFLGSITERVLRNMDVDLLAVRASRKDSQQ